MLILYLKLVADGFFTELNLSKVFIVENEIMQELIFSIAYSGSL